MTTRIRLAVVFTLVAALSLGVLAAADKLSSAAARTQTEIADILYDHADYWTAMRLYLRATECDDQAVRDVAHAGAVRSALRVAEFPLAVTHLAALRTQGSHDPVMLALAGDTLWASGRFDEAETAYTDAAAIEPGNPRARHGLAKALASKNQLARALDEVQAALRVAPTDSDLQHTLGSIYERMHRYSDAASAYTTYLSGLRTRDRGDKIRWARSHVGFLRSFDGTVPFEMIARNGVRRHVLDFRLVNGKVMIKAKVNGSKAVEFALDTGAEHSALSEATARKLRILPWTETLSAGAGMFGMRGLQVGKLESLEIGTLTIKNLPCLIKSPSVRDLPTDGTEAFSPLELGLSVSVDYRNRRVTLGEPVVDDTPALELPLRLNRLATVSGGVNGNPVSFIVDTGGEAISLNTSTARTLFTPADRHRIKLNVYGASGFDPEAYLLPGVNLAFGSVTMNNQPVVVLDLRAPSVLLGYEIGGIIGYRFLGRYHVDFDLQRSVLRLRDL